MEIRELIYEIEKKHVKLDDDYANMSKYLFDLGMDCEKELIKTNKELDEVQNKLLDSFSIVEFEKQDNIKILK